MTTPQQHQAPSVNDLLMGGGGPQSVKFPTIGHTVSGRITTQPTPEQQRDFDTDKPLFWDDGKPRWQIVVTLATSERDPANPEDDGTRRLFVKSQLQKAVSQAVRASGAPGLEVGGELTVTYTANGEQPNPRKAPPKLYAATYTPAATAMLHTPDPAPAPTAVPGLTQQQVQAAMANPATAALIQQQAAAAGTSEPPF
ncbi:hypothetical protein ACFVRD_34145 [Streptomyces sp. NPDC057908]|uniref:hypothetical protein n=1 Tax=Streptomyces sp. NPDC057908 TaxID=3346276 RepID=UPI0036F0680F